MTDVETMRAKQALRILTILDDCTDELYIRHERGAWYVRVEATRACPDDREWSGEDLADALSQCAQTLALDDGDTPPLWLHDAVPDYGAKDIDEPLALALETPVEYCKVYIVSNEDNFLASVVGK